MKNKTIILILVLFLWPLHIQADNGLASTSLASFDFDQISAQAVIVVDSTGHQILAHNENIVWPPASLTKLVTAMVFLDTNPNFKKVVAISRADQVSGGNLRTKVGTTYRLKDLFYASIVASANNATKALARSTGLNKDEFILRMNEKAASLGVVNTHFVEPTGLSEFNQTTASDMAKLAAAAFSYKEIQAAGQTPNYSFHAINRRMSHNIHNTNLLLQDRGVLVGGGKTGYIDESQYNFVTELHDVDGKNVIVVVFGSQNKQSEFAEAKQLAVWSWLNHPWGTVAGATTNLGISN